MGFLDRLFKGSRPDLDTWVVTARSSDGSWEGVSVEGTAKSIVAPSLGNAIDTIAAAVKERYKGHPKATTAELQYAIYPWEQGDIKFIFQIEKMTDDYYKADDTQGSGVVVTSTSLDDLVNMIATKIPDTSQAMLQWIRPISELK